MKLNQQTAASQPPLLDALDEAIGLGGVSELDPDVPEDVWNAALVGPAAAFLVRPGKDLRARLVRAGWSLGGGAPGAMPATIARAIELVHAGSLIVDDVQDGSDDRRGAPALHHLVGEPLAINTGSWMYFWALSELGRANVPGLVERAVAALVRCHQGQALDLATCIVDLEMKSVSAVVAATTRLKTGALCRLATELGAAAAGASDERIAAIGQLGESAGCALQMLDDLGCLVAVERRAKAVEDLCLSRPTWAWAWLAEQGDVFAWSRCIGLAKQVIGGGDPEPLIAALVERVETLGRVRVSESLTAAITRAQEALGASATPAIEALAAELRRMEAMYG